MSSASIFESLFLALPSLSSQHAPGSKVYALLKQVARREVEDLFYEHEPQVKEFKPFGELVFPYHAMGAIDSLNLFFSQKTNWQPVRDVDDMPTSYREGTLFVTCKSEIPWEG